MDRLDLCQYDKFIFECYQLLDYYETSSLSCLNFIINRSLLPLVVPAVVIASSNALHQSIQDDLSFPKMHGMSANLNVEFVSIDGQIL